MYMPCERGLSKNVLSQRIAANAQNCRPIREDEIIVMRRNTRYIASCEKLCPAAGRRVRRVLRRKPVGMAVRLAPRRAAAPDALIVGT
jgi:hypothetical protein